MKGFLRKKHHYSEDENTKGCQAESAKRGSSTFLKQRCHKSAQRPECRENYQ